MCVAIKKGTKKWREIRAIQTADEPLYFCRGLLFLDGEQSTGN